MIKYKKYMLLWLIAGILLLTASIFYMRSSSQNNRRYSIIYIPKTIDETNDFWTQLIEGVQMAASENKMDVKVVAPESEEDYERQIELIEWAIGQKPDAILLSPASYTETTKAAKDVKAAGIPLILVDSSVNEDIADAMIATDNVRLGEVAGEFMKQFVKKDSQIAIVGHVKDSSTAIEREKGVRNGLGQEEARIVDVVFCDSSYDKAYQLIDSLLEEYPDIDLVAGLNEYSAVGAARAIRDKNLEGKIRVVGIDSSLEEIKMLESGIFEGIVIQNPFKMGYMGVEVAARILNEEKALKSMDSGCELITRDNLYTEENQKLLFPFKEE